LPQQDVEFTLLENGLDFVLSALEHMAGDPSPREIKYSVLHLCSGIELVLKERLMREHWSLVFDKLEKAKKTTFESGRFNSVTFVPCIDRLIEIAGVDYVRAHRKELESFRDRRNQIEHFGFVDSIEAIKSSSSKVLNFLYDFIHRELAPTADLEEQLAEMLEYLREFDQFVKDRMLIVQEEVADVCSPIVECSRCRQMAVTIAEGEALCHFCRHVSQGEDAAVEYVEEIQGTTAYALGKNGFEFPVYDCPECGSSAVVENEEGIVCFSCGESWELSAMTYCDRCGRSFFRHETNSDLCESCFEDLSRD